MTETQVWLWLSLDSLQMACQVVGFVLGAMAFIGVIAVPISVFFDVVENFSFKPLWALVFFEPILLVVLVLSIATVFIPNTKQYAVIKVLPKIVNSDLAKEATGDAEGMYDMAKEYLKDMIKEKK